MSGKDQRVRAAAGREKNIRKGLKNIEDGLRRGSIVYRDSVEVYRRYFLKTGEISPVEDDDGS